MGGMSLFDARCKHDLFDQRRTRRGDHDRREDMSLISGCSLAPLPVPVNWVWDGMEDGSHSAWLWGRNDLRKGG